MFYALAASVWRRLQPPTKSGGDTAARAAYVGKKTKQDWRGAVRETTMMCSLKDLDHMHGGLSAYSRLENNTYMMYHLIRIL